MQANNSIPPFQMSAPAPHIQINPGTHPFFSRPQKVGDLDLTKAVRDVLTQSGTTADNLAAFDSHSNIIASIGKAPEVQLWHQKEFWNYQLIALQEYQKIDTSEDRILINQFTDPASWLTYFTNNVMDLVHTYNMPLRHGW